MVCATKTLLDYVLPPIDDYQSAIKKPAIVGNQDFEINPKTIYLIKQSQFSGSTTEYPNDHITNFVEICDTFKFHHVSDEAIRLRLLSFSLRDRAKYWLQSLPPDSITTWVDLCQKVLSKFFPLEKIVRLRNEIINFKQQDRESLYEAWDQFKELLRKFSHHSLPKWMQVQTFFIGLSASTRTMVNVAAGDEQCSIERQVLCDVDTPEMKLIKTLTLQVSSLAKQVQDNQAVIHVVQSLQQSKHVSHHQEQKSSLENIVTKMSEHTNSFMVETRSTLHNQSEQIRRLETQIIKIVDSLHVGPQVSIPSNTKMPLREKCNKITNAATIDQPSHEKLLPRFPLVATKDLILEAIDICILNSKFYTNKLNGCEILGHAHLVNLLNPNRRYEFKRVWKYLIHNFAYSEIPLKSDPEPPPTSFYHHLLTIPTMTTVM